mmetsp:Transcript_27492/g.47453  ORF Transcript_27492/g.47453 Transcript_27492/m.47453 type:complete len:247 (-) Transcript_27492:69-809(-)
MNSDSMYNTSTQLFSSTSRLGALRTSPSVFFLIISFRPSFCPVSLYSQLSSYLYKKRFPSTTDFPGVFGHSLHMVYRYLILEFFFRKQAFCEPSAEARSEFHPEFVLFSFFSFLTSLRFGPSVRTPAPPPPGSCPQSQSARMVFASTRNESTKMGIWCTIFFVEQEWSRRVYLLPKDTAIAATTAIFAGAGPASQHPLVSLFALMLIRRFCYRYEPCTFCSDSRSVPTVCSRPWNRIEPAENVDPH